MTDYHNEHYKEMPFEPLDIMKQVLTAEEYKGFLKGNILKYRLRAGYKGDAQEDLDKAMCYEELLKDMQTSGGNPLSPLPEEPQIDCFAKWYENYINAVMRGE